MGLESYVNTASDLTRIPAQAYLKKPIICSSLNLLFLFSYPETKKPPKGG